MIPIQYIEKVKVTSADLDELHHVNNVVYLKWVQQVAENHWRSAASQAIQDQYIWVVLSHFIQYHKPALLDDDLTLLTYVGDFLGVRSIRYVEIKRGTELITEAKTEWCMLDVENRRPRRVTEEVSKWFLKHNLPMKKAIKITLILIVSLLVMLLIAWMTMSESLPEGESGPRAEALADRMLLALNDSAYQQLEQISWKYPRGPHEYDWYKQKDTVEVRWDDMRVVLCTSTLDGYAYSGNMALSGDEREQALYTAWDFFANDSFWLVAPFKVRDPGTERKVVETDRGPALLVTYTSGGVTPGDSYLWILDENARPVAWKLWVQKIPLGGLETSWSNWQQYNGVWLGTSHVVGPLEINLEIQTIQ